MSLHRRELTCFFDDAMEENDNGEMEVFEERVHVKKAISDYFTDIYKRPEHMVPGSDDNF